MASSRCPPLPRQSGRWSAIHSRYTAPLGLNAFVDRASGSSYGGMLAMSVVTLVPTVAVFIVSQRRLVEGVATTGIK